MTIATQTLSIPLDNAGIGMAEAMLEFAASLSSKALVRRSKDLDVVYDMQFPFFLDAKVNSRALGDGLGSLIGETMDRATPGDRAIIDFALIPDGHLTLTVRPWEPPRRSGAAEPINATR